MKSGGMDHELRALLAALAAPQAAGAHLRMDSRAVQPGDVFVALAGARADGRAFIESAQAAGAAAVLVEADGVPTDETPLPTLTIPVLPVRGLRARLGDLAHHWYGQPSSRLTVIAVTGTNGKTSCVQWLAQALNAGGVPCGAIGTLGLTFGEDTQPGYLTTPDVLTLHRVLAQWHAAGAQAVALEASSIGIEQGRLDGVQIDIAAWSNLSHDHLDYHGDLAAYTAAKRRLLAWPGLRAAVVNADDAVGARALAECVDRGQIPVRIAFSVQNAFSLHNQVATSGTTWLRATALHADEREQSFSLSSPQETAPVRTALVGTHNVENLLLVAGVLHALDWPLADIARALGQLKPVAGRLEPVAVADLGLDAACVPQVLVDYAHTPDALARALTALQPTARARGGRLVCVFGCGGERDAAKRPAMGRMAAQWADAVVVTSDNPRSEDPQAIMDQIMAGISDTACSRVVPNRAEAILHALWSASAQDVVLIAGKGHETYQEVAGLRHRFDDAHWARAALALWPAPDLSTDTRALRAGEVFLALVGEHHDGHDHLASACAAGARAAIVARRVEQAGTDLPQLVLGDTQAALTTLARAWRAQHDLPLIAVTGSNGKTTTKEMVAAILAAWLGAEARLASPGNYNNHIGVPLTLLRLRAAHRVAVVELGMNHPGEIAALAALAAPTVALVNNAQREHLEFMHSVAAVAAENGSVLAALPAHGTAVYPLDDEYTPLWNSLSGTRARLRFSVDDDAADIFATEAQLAAEHSCARLTTPAGSGELHLPLPGAHNLHNALAAMACTHAVGVPLAVALTALASFGAVAGRMQHHRLAAGITLIDDTYNANPDSVRAAIAVLAALPAPRVLVLGDMGEVGANGPALHHEVGAYARACGIDTLYTLGAAGVHTRAGFGTQAGAEAQGFDEIAPLVHALLSKRPASVLVKGSRTLRMERVVAACLAQWPGRASTLDTTGAAHAA